MCDPSLIVVFVILRASLQSFHSVLLHKWIFGLTAISDEFIWCRASLGRRFDFSRVWYPGHPDDTLTMIEHLLCSNESICERKLTVPLHWYRHQKVESQIKLTKSWTEYWISTSHLCISAVSPYGWMKWWIEWKLYLCGFSFSLLITSYGMERWNRSGLPYSRYWPTTKNSFILFASLWNRHACIVHTHSHTVNSHLER